MLTSNSEAPAPGEPVVASQPVGKRSGCMGTLMSGGCGCLAFVIGAALATAVFGTHLLSGWGERALEEILEGDLNAEVEVSGVSLSWVKPQKIESLTVLGEDGRQLAQASAELPSLMDLLGGPRQRPVVKVDILSLRSRVAKDGTDDLQRATQIGGRGMLEVLLRSLVEAAGDGSGWSDFDLSLTVKDWDVDDTGQGRGRVQVRDMEASVVCRPGHAAVEVKRALVSWSGQEEPVEVSAGVALTVEGAEVGEREVAVNRLHLSSGGAPLGVARSLGILTRTPRVEDRPRSDLDAWVHRQLVTHLIGELERGALVTAEVGPAPGGGEMVGRFEVDGEGMKLSLSVEWAGGQMVPGPRAQGDPLEIQLLGQRGRAARMIEGLLGERFSAEQADGALDWMVSSRSFSVPLQPLQLLDFKNGLEASMGGMRLEADARVVGPSTSSIRLSVPSESPAGLDLDHYLTSLAFEGAAGMTVSSFWRGRASRLATLKLQSPAAVVASGGPGGGSGQMKISGYDVPLAMLGGARALPPQLTALLPETLKAIRLEGMALPSPGWSDALQAGGKVTFDINAGPRTRLVGLLEGSVLSLPQAHLEVGADRAAGEALFKRLLPWFSAVGPQDGGDARLTVDVRNYSVDLRAPEFRDTGQMDIGVGAMQARLQPRLAGEHFDVGEEEWVEWGPEQVKLDLDEGIVRYRAAQIPLGADEEPIRISGFLDREDEVLSVTAVVPANVIVGGADAGILPARMTLTGPAAGLELAVDRSLITELLEALRGGVPTGAGQ